MGGRSSPWPHARLLAARDGRRRVDGFEPCLDRLEFGLVGHEVGLVEQDTVCEGDLGHRAPTLRMKLQPGICPFPVLGF